MPLPPIESLRIAVIGLGYVGLPLAAYIARHFNVVGFDIDKKRIDELRDGYDRTCEVAAEELRLAQGLSFTADEAELKWANFFIITVPTPIDRACRPDTTALGNASLMVGRALKVGDIVVYESTVYPGATEEICVPILERISGLRYNRDFFAGYSPERINPGDHKRRLPNIRKITSGSTPEVSELVDAVYSRVITAGTYRASSIRVAEAAKVIENVQRDINIALMNELAQLFKRLGLETREVLEAAETKWNFHPYRPGLVGGHCIGVDPYYLTHKAQMVGFHPEMILAGRRINDGMAVFVANDIVKAMVLRKIPVGAARILVAGFTFKENCPDTRNTKVADLVRELEPFARELIIYDPHANQAEAREEYGLEVVNSEPDGKFDAIVLAVRHDEVVRLASEGLWKNLLNTNGFIYDIKGVLPISDSDFRL